MGENAERHGAVAYALATWVFLMHIDGVEADDAEIARQNMAIGDATDESAGNTAGEALVDRVAAMLGGEDPQSVETFARSLFGDRVDAALGEGSRSERVHRIRKFQFSTNRPWLARIWERNAEGAVVPSWLVVEAVTDEVRAMDPNPWNDIDETRRIPVADFQVLWELDGCTSIAVA